MSRAVAWRAGIGSVPPEVLIIGAALSVQVGASVATGLVRTYAPITIVALRLVFSALLLVGVRPPRLAVLRSPRAWQSAVALGFVFVGMNTAFYVAISRLPLGVAVTIEFAGPLAVAVLGSRRIKDMVWVALAAAGIYLLAGGDIEANDILGVVAALAAGAGWALFIVTGAWVSRTWPDGRGLSAALVVASVLVVPIALVAGDLGAVVVQPRDLGLALIVALFSSALPWSLEIAALGRMRGATYGVLMSLEPAIAAIVGFVVLGQVLGPVEAAAIGLVGVASAGASLTARVLATTPGELENA